MVIIIQDPAFFLNYVIVHCNFTYSVGVTVKIQISLQTIKKG